MADRVQVELLGFLLGALEDGEQESIRERLDSEPTLRQQLEHLRQRIAPLQAVRERHVPPPGLARRTCRFVMARAKCGPDAAGDRPSAAVPPVRAAVPLPAPSWVSRWSWQDLAVAAGIVAAAVLLVFPAIENSRFNAQVTTCRDNLRQVGMALASYSQRFTGYFPPVAAQGRMAAAGIYAPVLVRGGDLADPRRVICPGSAMAGEGPFRIPSLEELQTVAEGPLLERLRQSMGGSYGYPLGFVEGGEHHPVRNLRRAFFALMADMPDPTVPGLQSANHGGRGQNVLFEDFHVQFMSAPRAAERTDYFFLNDTGQVAAGTHRDDSVIAGSGTSPLVGGYR